MSRKILCILSEWGFWGEELVGPLDALDKQGYEVVFATNKGRRPLPLPASMDPSLIDPPLGRSVTSEENAHKTREISESGRLDNPLSLASWLPERSYRSSPNFLREMESYNNRLDEIRSEIEREYDAILIVGGSGALLDLANNYRLHELILSFYALNQPIAAECYGVACLAFARNEDDRKSIIWGRHVTGHIIEYDYQDGTTFVGTDINIGPPPYPLEYILRDAVGPDGQFHRNFGHQVSVIADYPFLTGRSTADSYTTGRVLVDMLEHGLRYYGWRGPYRADSFDTTAEPVVRS
jgi:putative intracellular protease/amidase